MVLIGMPGLEKRCHATLNSIRVWVLCMRFVP